MLHTSRRRSAALVLVAVLCATGLVLLTRTPPVPAAPAASAVAAVHPVCGLRGRLPAPLFRLVLQILRVTCPPPTTSTSTSTSTSTTTTTFPPLGDVFGFEGYLGVQTCQGTAAAPVSCGAVVPVAGQVRIGERRVDTRADGFYRAAGFFGTQEVQGVVPTPAGRSLWCPIQYADPSAGGPVGTRVDPVCQSFPVTPTSTHTTTTRIIADSFGIEGVLLLVTCEGTPAAPVDCGPPVATAGQVRVAGYLLDTAENGFYQISRPVSGPVQGILPAPPGRILDCPVVNVSGSAGGPRNTRFDPVCRSFPAPHDH
jgi:hypothetical protein